MLSGDVRATVRAAVEGGDAALSAFRMQLFRPLQPMLADTAIGVDEVLASLPEASFELKLDGARVQVHKEGAKVRVYTRALHEVSVAVPEVVAVVRTLRAKRAVLDGEVIALGGDGRPLSFQTTMRRFGRKSATAAAQLREELPLSVFFFDCLLLDGDELIDEPERVRAAALEGLCPPELVVPRLRTDDAHAAEVFLAQAIRDGHEGLVAKDPDSPYQAGHRGGAWLKLKPAYTLDLVVLAAELCGDDALAEFYAARGPGHYAVKPVQQASCRAIRGRIAARRGDRSAALEHWRAAAAGVLAAKQPLLVLRVGEEWEEIH